jgi:hypothetical protein
MILKTIARKFSGKLAYLIAAGLGVLECMYHISLHVDMQQYNVSMFSIGKAPLTYRCSN